MQHARKKRREEGPGRRLVLVAKGVARRWRVGDMVDVRLGSELVRALVIEDRGPLGPNGSQVVRVEVQATSSDGDAERFEVPAAAILKLKAPGTGHGRSASLDAARAQAAANARTWVLTELDAENSPTAESSYVDGTKLEVELNRRGLSSAQRQALYRGEEVVLAAAHP